MAQFDVYLNPSSRTRNIFPFIVDFQNSLISDLATRIVVPLGNLEFFNNEKMDLLTPQIEYEDKQLLYAGTADCFNAVKFPEESDRITCTYEE